MKTRNLNLVALTVRLSLCATMIGLVAAPVAGQDSGAYLFGSVNRIDPDVSLGFDEDGITADAKISAAEGVGLEVGYRFGRRVAFGLDVNVAELDVDLTGRLGDLGFSFEASDALEVAIATIGVDFFLFPEQPVSLFFGPVAGAIGYGNLDFGLLEQLVGETDVVGDVAYGGRVGIDVKLGEGGWKLRAVVRKLLVDAEFDSGDIDVTTGFDPTIASIGIGYQF